VEIIQDYKNWNASDSISLDDYTSKYGI
jgi:hypothetical protein